RGYGDRHRRIGHVAVLLGDQIQLHQVSGPDDPRAGNSVDCFIVHTDTAVAREVEVIAWSMSGPRVLEFSSSHGVDFRGGRSRAYLRGHRPECRVDHPSNGRETAPVFFSFDRHLSRWCHALEDRLARAPLWTRVYGPPHGESGKHWNVRVVVA